MATEITCPNCGHQFEPSNAIREEVEKELRSKAADWQKKKNEEFQLRLEEEKKQLQQSLETTLRKNISGDFENKLRLLEQNNKDNEEKLKLSRQKELEYLQKEQVLLNKEKEIDLQLQRMLLEERSKLSELIRKEEAEKSSLKDTEYQLRLKEMEEKLEAQKKLAEEMKRKAEQGSMQSQGEAQELALEEMLRESFPFDLVNEVGKGVRGADCIQTVRNQFGQECGKIIFESKRTENFGADWIEKLKTDMHNLGADIAVLVTKRLPKDMSQFGEKSGVYLCSFAEAKSLVSVLRTAILKIAEARKLQENKGDKMTAIYDYITGQEFRRSLQMMRENFRNLQSHLDKEKEDFEKNWQKKKKMIQSIIDNSSHISGSIEGISGKEVDLNLLEDSATDANP
jgi:hypothetical protein